METGPQQFITKEKHELIFSAIEAAQVSITAFSEITGVSRVTLHRWKNTRPTKGIDRLRFSNAYNVAVRMRNAIKTGDLPLPETIERKQKLNTMKRIIRNAPAVLV